MFQLIYSFSVSFVYLYRSIYVQANAVAQDRDLSAFPRHGLARYSSHAGLQEHENCRRPFPPRPFCREKERYEEKGGYVQGSLLSGFHFYCFKFVKARPCTRALLNLHFVRCTDGHKLTSCCGIEIIE